MASSSLHVHRARVASLSRSRPPDDPDLVEARLCMQQEVLVNTVTRALQKAPPITSQVRDRIIALISDVLTTPDCDGGATTDATTVYDDRRNRMIINVHMADEARYAWARGRRSIENLRVTIHELVRDRRSDAKDDVGTIHVDFMMLTHLLQEATVAGLGPQANSDEEERRGYQWYNRYSDGTPVAILTRIAGGCADELPSEIFRTISMSTGLSRPAGSWWSPSLRIVAESWSTWTVCGSWSV